MKIITKITFTAIGLIASSASAYATCSGTPTPGAPSIILHTNAAAAQDCLDTINDNESAISVNTADILSNAANISQNATDITSLQGQVNSNDTDITALQAENTAQGVTLADHEGRITTLEGNDVVQDAAITALQSQNAAQQTEIDANTASNTAQDATLANHEGRITTNESDIADLQSENASQQTEIDNNTAGVAANAATNATQQVSIDANTAKNVIQDNRLDGHDTAIGNLQIDNANQWTSINANTALLSQHSATLGKHAKGIAIATAMPDTWLMPEENFAIAGGFGGFDDETAFAATAIARIDKTWSFNAGVGSDLDFEQFGWKAGLRAGF